MNRRSARAGVTFSAGTAGFVLASLQQLVRDVVSGSITGHVEVS